MSTLATMMLFHRPPPRRPDLIKRATVSTYRGFGTTLALSWGLACAHIFGAANSHSLLEKRSIPEEPSEHPAPGGRGRPPSLGERRRGGGGGSRSGGLKKASSIEPIHPHPNPPPSRGRGLKAGPLSNGLTVLAYRPPPCGLPRIANGSRHLKKARSAHSWERGPDQGSACEMCAHVSPVGKG